MTTDLSATPAPEPALAGATALADTQVAGLLFHTGLPHASGPLLQAYLNLLDEFLRADPPLSRADRLHLITLRYGLKLRQEAEELAANSVLRQDRTIAAARFARKAQSGFSPLPLPE